jgi:hypothetical protein
MSTPGYCTQSIYPIGADVATGGNRSLSPGHSHPPRCRFDVMAD